jgi:hypothetical protein
LKTWGFLRITSLLKLRMRRSGDYITGPGGRESPCYLMLKM